MLILEGRIPGPDKRILTQILTDKDRWRRRSKNLTQRRKRSMKSKTKSKNLTPRKDRSMKKLNLKRKKRQEKSKIIMLL